MERLSDWMVETARLRLEPLSESHLAGYAALIAQPDVHRYLARAAEIAADPSSQASRIIGLSAAQWRERGYGSFAIFEKGDMSLISRGGLFWIESLQAVEINYMFDPAVWGHAYATEAAHRFLAIGFGTHGLARLVATTGQQRLGARAAQDRDAARRHEGPGRQPHRRPARD